jgi:nitroreductase
LEKRLDRSAFHHQRNAPVFDEAAPAVFFIGEMAAIVSAYEERATHLAILEAGLMTQTLELVAPACGLGLCQIGSADIAAVRELFGLSGSQELLHTLFAGAPDVSASGTVDGTDEGRVNRLIERVEALTPEEARSLLGQVRLDRNS